MPQGDANNKAFDQRAPSPEAKTERFTKAEWLKPRCLRVTPITKPSTKERKALRLKQSAWAKP